MNQACHAPGGTLRSGNGATMSTVRTATCRLRSSHFGRNVQESQRSQRIGVYLSCANRNTASHTTMRRTPSTGEPRSGPGTQAQHNRIRQWKKVQMLSNVWKKSLVEMDEHFSLLAAPMTDWVVFVLTMLHPFLNTAIQRVRLASFGT